MRAIVYQVIAVAAVAWVVRFPVSNTPHNLSSRHISTGFGFLDREGRFPPSARPHPLYTGRYLRARHRRRAHEYLARGGDRHRRWPPCWARVIGIARLSRNWLIARLASIYVEVMRNIPLLLQLFFWYALITENMPGPRQAHQPLPGVFISNRGLKLPTLQGSGLDLMLGGFWGWRSSSSCLLGALGQQTARGHGTHFSAGALGTGADHPAARAGLARSAARRSAWTCLALRGFNSVGGMTLSPEFAALLAGLVSYTAAFVAEVVRSGVQAVNIGQWEAAGSLGLRRVAWCCAWWFCRKPCA